MKFLKDSFKESPIEFISICSALLFLCAFYSLKVSYDEKKSLNQKKSFTQEKNVDEESKIEIQVD
jgi:hypothetical protein